MFFVVFLFCWFLVFLTTGTSVKHLCRRPIWHFGKTSCRSHRAKRWGLIWHRGISCQFPCHLPFFLYGSELEPFSFAGRCPDKAFGRRQVDWLQNRQISYRYLPQLSIRVTFLGIYHFDWYCSQKSSVITE